MQKIFVDYQAIISHSQRKDKKRKEKFLVIYVITVAFFWLILISNMESACS
jgi:hypothetical protein